MQDTERKIKEEIEELIREGKEIIRISSNSPADLKGSNLSWISSWVTKTGHLILSVVTKESEFYKQYSSRLDEKDFYGIHSNHYVHLIPILGSLEALYDALNKGLLGDVRNYIRAEIFTDFLEMAEYFLKKEKKDPAAILIGVVLEDSLRKIAITNNIDIFKDNEKYKNLDALNQELYSKGIYNLLINKQITSYGEIRNKAVHANFDKYELKDVERMLSFVKDFCSKYMS
ncbi:MAG TPA: hypothetical protein PLI06_09225 [Methanofastidiosum sp.]|nr:hypothetical protein [Methanofastidiosum sp.]